MDDVKAYLKQVRIYDTHINGKLEELARLNDLAFRVTSELKPDVVSCGGGNHDKVGDAACKIVDMENEINKAIDALVALKKEISAVIDQIDDPIQLKMLYLMYFGEFDADTHETNYLTLMEVAVRLRTSYRNACYIHGAALQAVAKVLERTKG